MQMVKHIAVSKSCNTKITQLKGSRVKNCAICKFTMKNIGSVHGTIEITLEQIMCDIARIKMRQIHIVCIMALDTLSSFSLMLHMYVNRFVML